MGISDPSKLYDEIAGRLDECYLDLRKPELALPDALLMTPLFHFTDPRGLLGIVKQKLWASSADFLNDSSEPRHALDVLQESLREVVQKVHPGSAAANALDDCWAWAMKEYEQNGPHVYVFCLSEHDDLLSQWRGYGAQGSGYAIGFSGSQLSRLLRADQGQYLLKVVYDRQDQKKEAKRVYGRIVAVIDQSEREFGPINEATVGEFATRIRNRLRNAVFAEIVRLRAKFKTSAFSEEGEWRIVQFMHPRVDKPSVVQFRPGVASIKPYVELDFSGERLPIEQVTVGPTLNGELSRQSLRRMFAKCGYPDVHIELSNVPYRL
jgi:hypothetical protein